MYTLHQLLVFQTCSFLTELRKGVIYCPFQTTTGQKFTHKTRNYFKKVQGESFMYIQNSNVYKRKIQIGNIFSRLDVAIFFFNILWFGL